VRVMSATQWRMSPLPEPSEDLGVEGNAQRPAQAACDRDHGRGATRADVQADVGDVGPRERQRERLDDIAHVHEVATL